MNTALNEQLGKIKAWLVEQAEPLTTKLRAGQVVLAKMYKGTPYAKTYPNRTGAEKAVAKAGRGWVVVKIGRPFYVAKQDSLKA